MEKNFEYVTKLDIKFDHLVMFEANSIKPTGD